MKKLILTYFTVLLLLCGCGSSGGGLEPSSLSQRGSILLSQVLARAVPSEVTHQRFSGYDTRGGLVYGPLLTEKSASTLLSDVPIEVVSLQIEQFRQTELVGIGSVDVELRMGQTTQVADPPTQSLNAPILSLQLTPGETSISQDGAKQFAAVAFLVNKEQVDVTDSIVWGSSQPDVARAFSSGRVNAVSPGDSTIVGRVAQIEATSQLTVLSTSINSLRVTPESATIADDTTQQLTALAQLSDGTFQDVSQVVQWTATGSAAVNKSGVLSVNDPGSVTVGASLANQSASVQVSVTSATPVSINVSSLEGGDMPTGAGRRLEATAVFSDSTSQNVSERATWSSSNPALATVDTTGVVTALMPGTVEIGAEFTGLSGSTVITITDQTIVSLRVEPQTRVIADDTEVQLQAVATLSDGQERVLTEGLSWRSLNPAQATILPSGLLTGVNPGQANFEVAHGPSSLTAGGGVSISSATITGLAVTPSEALSAPGTSREFRALATFSDSTVQDVTNRVVWSSDNPNVFFPEQTDDLFQDGRAVIELDATSDVLGSTVTASLGSLSASSKLRINQFLYLVDAGSNQISAYRMDAQGNLTAIGTTGVSLPTALAIAPSGRFAYALSRTGPGITSYIIQPDGILRSIGLPAGVAGGGRSIDLEISRDERYLYATNTGGKISQFLVNGDGTLTSNGTVDSVDPGSITSSASGNEILVTNAADGRVSSFSIDAQGQLNLLGRAVVGGSDTTLEHLTTQGDGVLATLLATDATSQSIIVLGQKKERLFEPVSVFQIDLLFGAAESLVNDPLRRFCYILQNDVLSILKFRPDGKLEFSDRTFISAIAGDFQALRIDPTGRFLIFPNYEQDTVTSLQISPDGSVNPQGSAPFPTTSPGVDAVEMTP